MPKRGHCPSEARAPWHTLLAFRVPGFVQIGHRSEDKESKTLLDIEECAVDVEFALSQDEEWEVPLGPSIEVSRYGIDDGAGGVYHFNIRLLLDQSVLDNLVAFLEMMKRDS
jgi:hypothetical protein